MKTKQGDLVKIVDGSFDAALLIDRKGRIRHANTEFEDLFDISGSDIANEIDALIEFLPLNDGVIYSCWKDIFKTLPDEPSQWKVRCFKQHSELTFSGTLKLSTVRWKDDNTYVFGCLRVEEKQDYRKEKRFDESTDPMMAIDERGHILMFNQAAVENVEWCEPSLVGQHISYGLDHTGFESQPDPIIAVDNTGMIVSVNTAAKEGILWCTPDLIGKNLLQLGKEATSHFAKTERLGETDESSGNETEDLSTAGESLKGVRGSYFSMLFSAPAGKLGMNLTELGHETNIFTRPTGETSVTTKGQVQATEANRKSSPVVLRIFLQQQDCDSSTSTSGSTSNAFHSVNEKSDQTKENVMMSIVEAALDPVFQINENGIIHMVNRAAVRQFGYSREQFLGHNISMIVGGGHASNHDKYLKKYLETGITKVIGKKRMLQARRSDGSEFPIELGVVEVDTFHGDERLFCGIVHDLTLRLKKEQITTDIVEASLDPMFLISESGTIRMVNKAALKQFGFEKSELIDKNISCIVGGGHAKNHDKYLKNYLTSGKTKVIGKMRELPARRKDGSEFPILLGVVEMNTNSDEERMFCGFVHDLTMVKSNARISEGIIESSLDSMFQIDDHGSIEMVNDAAVETFGWSREELMGKNISMIVPLGHAEKHDNYLRRFRQTGSVHLVGQRRELTARKRDGTEFPIEIHIAPIEDKYTKTTKFCGFLRDLTDAHEQNSKLLKRDFLLEGMINSSLDAMFQIDHTGVIQTVNTAATRVFGWNREELIGSNISIIVGKEHAGKHDKYLERYLETGEKRAMGKKRELSARRKDGLEIPIELSLTEVTSTDGIRTFCGFVRDLSTLVQQSDITNGMIDASMDPMFLIDSRGIIQMVNAAACTHFGWTNEEFLNSNIKMICGGDHGKHHDIYMKSYMNTGESGVIGARRILPGRRKDGTEFPIELAVVEVKRSSGNYFCGYARVMEENETNVLLAH